MQIDVLALNGAFDTGLAAVLDAFATANELAPAQGLASTVFDVTVVGVRRHIRTAQVSRFRSRPLTTAKRRSGLLSLRSALRRRDRLLLRLPRGRPA